MAIGRVGSRDVIVSGGWDESVRVWDAGSGQPMGQPLRGHFASVEAVAIGRARRRDIIVSGGYDHMVRVWDATSGDPIGGPLKGHRGAVEAVAIGRVGSRDIIISGGGDPIVRVWDAEDGTSLMIDLLAQPEAIALSNNGSSLCVSAGNAICLFDVQP